MPLARITLQEGHSAETIWAISDGVYKGKLETINVPEHDRFQVILEQAKQKLIADQTYLNIPRAGTGCWWR